MAVWSVYRCAMCGSSKIETEVRKEGYSKKKGFLGMFLFGSGGAAMGVGGNEVTYYHCKDCGQVLNHAMPDVEKTDIDICLSLPDMNKSKLEKYKSKYKNIEWEPDTISSKEETCKDIAVDMNSEKSLEDKIIEYIKNSANLCSYDEIENKFGKSPILDMIKLENKAILTREYIGDKLFYRFVTDANEKKELLLIKDGEESGKEYVNKLSQEEKTALQEKIVSIISKMEPVSSNDLMKAVEEEIYTDIKSNNIYTYLSIVAILMHNGFKHNLIYVGRNIHADEENYKKIPLAVIAHEDKYISDTSLFKIKACNVYLWRTTTEKEKEDFRERIHKMVNSRLKSRQKKNEEDETIGSEIIDFLKENYPRKFTITEIISESDILSKYTDQRVSIILRRLVNEETLKKYVEKKKSYFQYNMDIE